MLGLTLYDWVEYAYHHHPYVHIDSVNSSLPNILQQNSNKVSPNIHHMKFCVIYFWYSIQSNVFDISKTYSTLDNMMVVCICRWNILRHFMLFISTRWKHCFI